MGREERQEIVEDALDKLKKRNWSGAGKVTQGDIGRAIGVHQNTVARWERSVMLPDDDDTVEKVLSIVNHVNDWHLRISQFMVVESDPPIEGSPFSYISYEPTDAIDIAKVEVKLNAKFESMRLVTIGSDRNRVLISSSPSNFTESLELEGSGKGRANSLSKGKMLRFFLKFES